MTPSTICFLVLFLTTLSTSYSFIATTKMSFVVTTVLKTPLNLEEIFKARCKEYITIVNPEAFIENPKNCDRLWQLFKQAFAYKPECSVKPEDFKDFIEEADHLGKIKNKVMLWSGNVYPFVLDYAQSRKYITIRDQLSVFILRNVENWCGKTEEPGINYEGCQPYQQCQNNAVGAFWTQMSSFFVLKAEGTVSVMFNSSSEVAFNENKTFGRAELPNLHKDKVQKLEVFLVGNLREPKLETCEVGSMQKLRDIVEKKGINFKCWDSHPSVWHLQCLKSQEGCSFIRAKNSSILRSFGLSFLVIFSALCLHAVDFSAF